MRRTVTAILFSLLVLALSGCQHRDAAEITPRPVSARAGILWEDDFHANIRWPQCGGGAECATMYGPEPDGR